MFSLKNRVSKLIVVPILVASVLGSFTLNVILLRESSESVHDSKEFIRKFIDQEDKRLAKLNVELWLDKNSLLNDESIVAMLPWLQNFSNVGVLSETSKYPFTSSTARNIMSHCDFETSSWKKLYFASDVTFQGNKAVAFLKKKIKQSAIQISIVDNSNSCRKLYQGAVILHSNGIYQYTISSPQMKAQYPIHIANLGGNRILLSDRYSKIYLQNSQGSFQVNDVDYLGEVLRLDNKSIVENGGVKSLDVLDDTLLVSMVYKSKKCIRFEIYKASVSKILDFDENQNNLISDLFQLAWKMPNCFKELQTGEGMLNLNGSGGRIRFLNSNRFLLSIGNPENWEGTEKNIASPKLGTILEVNLLNGNSKVISKGHRNQQGLCFINNSIIASEQGPDGGDELNLIKRKSNYGWPISSYGFPYGYKEASKFFRFGSHDFGRKPLFSWIPSIAVGDINCSNMNNSRNIEIMIATLKDMALHRVFISSDFVVRYDQRIPLGKRLRDLIRIDDSFVISTDSNELIRLKFHDVFLKNRL